MNNQNFNNQNSNNPNPGYRNNNPSSPGNGSAIASLVLGIISCVIGWLPILNFIALITSSVGLNLAKQERQKTLNAGMPTGLCTAGFVLNAVGGVVVAISLIFLMFALSSFRTGVFEGIIDSIGKYVGRK